MEVLDTILDKGIVIDVFVRVSLVGIELLTVDARVVIASVDTYLRFAQAIQKLGMADTRKPGLPDLLENVGGSPVKKKARGVLEAAKEKISDLAGGREEGWGSDKDKWPAEAEEER